MAFINKASGQLILVTNESLLKLVHVDESKFYTISHDHEYAILISLMHSRLMSITVKLRISNFVVG